MITRIAHFLAGALSGFLSFVNPVSAVLLTILFIIYELDEDWHLSDEAYRDIREFTVGFSVACVVEVLLCVL